MDYSPAEGSTSHILLLSDSVVQPSNSNSDTDVSTDTSIAPTPQESSTPTGTVVVNSRDRSGTIIARPIWDHIPTTTGAVPNPATTTAAPFQTTTTRTRRLRHHRELPPESPSDTSRPDTETEDDGDIDMDRMDLEEEEEEEDDSGRMDSDVLSTSASASASGSSSPERAEIHQLPQHRHHHRHHLVRHGHPHTLNRGRRAVGIVSDEPTNGPQTLQVDGGDAHIIINEAGVGGVEVGVGPVRVGEVGVGVEDGIVSLEPNDDFAMGAPPGAPGAIGEGVTPRGLNLEGVGRRRNRTISGVATGATTTTTGTTGDAPDATPRAAVIGLPMMVGNNGTIRGGQQQGHQRHSTIRARPALESPTPGAGPVIPATTPTTSPTTATHPPFPTRTSNASASHTPPHHTASDSGPYRDEDVLLSLQLLAYLSKYPHVRQAFYKPRVTFHPASAELSGQRFGIGSGEGKEKGRKEKERKGEKGEKGLEKEKDKGVAPSSSSTKETPGGSFKAFTNTASVLSSPHSNTGAATSSRGKERAQLNPSSTSSSLTVMAQLESSSSSLTSSTSKPTPPPSATLSSASPRQTNVFSLVERFTFKPSSTETDLPNPPPRLPPEIQYWAGVIMRNACRKDDSRGGIRQCANSKKFPFIVLFYRC